MHDKIKICSMNCQGLGDNRKRRDVLNFLRKSNYSILCLQDTHFSKETENLIANEWGYKAYFSSFNSRSRGVAIFFQNNFEFKILNSFHDNSGNVLILNIELEKLTFLLVCLYGPNKDEPVFYQDLLTKILKYSTSNIVIVGDWNVTLNPELDCKNYKNINNPRARNEVLRIMNELNLYDVWREENLEEKLFTWKRKLEVDKIQMGRLDFFLLSENVLKYSCSENIVPGYRTDHSLIELTLNFKEQEGKGGSFWKFNNSLLFNNKFIQEAKEKILNVKKQYAALPYIQDKIFEIDNKDLGTTINPQLFLEMILLELRGLSIAFSSNLKKQENIKEKEIEQKILELENLNLEENFDLISQLKQELQLLRENKLKGVLVRSKARWIEKGEKPSRYFLNLENRHFISKKMSSLINKDGLELTKPVEIRQEVFNFYKKLYSSNEENITNVDLNALLNEDTKKLSDYEAFSIEGSITFKEAGTVLMKIQNNKSPGSSGFTGEFFKFFWSDLGHFVVKAINHGFLTGELSAPQREGIITCIPKGDKSKKYIKNWRPISLLNVVYKIASGCIAKRVKGVLPSIINMDQSGFMAGRFTGDNIRLIYDILNQSKLDNQSGILLLIDFEKAFDSVAWSFMEKCLVYFNFKEDIRKWIKVFYKNIKSSIIVNNRPTQWFAIERGCRQGDPISPYIFLICSEVLAHMVRQKKDILGFKIFNQEVKISQYADDTSLFLDGSKVGFEVCIETILEYAKYSGLAMNFEKTKVIVFGDQNVNYEDYMPHLKFEWNPKKFKILGVEFSLDMDNISDINIELKLAEMQREINIWAKRDITPFGRITVIKSLILSKIVHILIALPTPSSKLFKKINKMLYDFLWDGKPDKIKRHTAKLSLENGGLGMIDIELFDKAMKLTWIRRLINSSSTWKTVIHKVYPDLSYINQFGDWYIYNLSKDVNNPFWKNVLMYFSEFNSKFKISSIEELKATCFQLNNTFKIGNSPIDNAILKSVNIYYVNQLMNDNDFLSHEEFEQKFEIQIDYLTYYSIIRCLKKSSDFENLEEHNSNFNFQPALNTILKQKKGASKIYKIFIDFSTDCNGKFKANVLTGISGEEWLTSFSVLKFTTQDTKLRWLQFRILHLILTTNRSVSKFKENQTDLCTFCNLKSETIQHLFWECTVVKDFWQILLQTLKNRCAHANRLVFDERLILFGHSEYIFTDIVLNKIILLAKMYIYRNKVQNKNLNVQIFLRYLYDRFCVEKTIAKNPDEMEKIWYPYKKLFQSLL